MVKRYKSLSLSIKISLLFMLMNFIVVGAFTVILYFYFMGTVNESVTGAVNSTVTANTNELENLLRRIEISCELVHNNEVIYSNESVEAPAISKMIIEYYPMEHNENLMQLRDDYATNLELFNSYFKTCFGDESGYSNILYVDTKWPISVYMQKKTIIYPWNGFYSSVKIKNTDWYQTAEEMSGENYWYIDEGTGQLCMAKLLKYRYIGSNTKLCEDNLGVLTVCFDSSVISRHLNLSGLTMDSEVMLLDQNDMIIYANDSEKMGTTINGELSQINLNESHEITYEGRACLINQKELPLGLQIITIVPIDDIHQMTAQTVRIIGIVGIVMIAIAIFFTIFLSQTVVSPLRKFAEHMEAGKTERFEFDHSRRDEVGTLYRAFNHLMRQLEQSMENTLEANEKKKQAELNALQAQINPHFVYNTLNSISCLAMINKQEYIAELIGSLTKILRYNISNPDRMVSVAEELHIIKQYESIQKSCYRESIYFEYEVVPETESIMIPKLMIQPLIENALIHSINYKEKIICIHLLIYMVSNNLIIEVWDNGTEANVEKINQYITGQVVYEGNSLGVRNVYERMKIVFGNAAELKYEKDENGNTVARFRIPITDVVK